MSWCLRNGLSELCVAQNFCDSSLCCFLVSWGRKIILGMKRGSLLWPFPAPLHIVAVGLVWSLCILIRGNERLLWLSKPQKVSGSLHIMSINAIWHWVIIDISVKLYLEKKSSQNYSYVFGWPYHFILQKPPFNDLRHVRTGTMGNYNTAYTASCGLVAVSEKHHQWYDAL